MKSILDQNLKITTKEGVSFEVAGSVQGDVAYIVFNNNKIHKEDTLITNNTDEYKITFVKYYKGVDGVGRYKLSIDATT